MRNVYLAISLLVLQFNDCESAAFPSKLNMCANIKELHIHHTLAKMAVFRPFLATFMPSTSERYTSSSKEAGLVIYLVFLAKVANLYYMILTAYKKYWPDTVAKFISGTQQTFI